MRALMAETFTVPPPPAAWALLALLAAVLGFIALILLSPAQIRVTRDEIVVRAYLLFSESASRGEVEEVKVVDLREDAGLKPTVRLSGTSLGGWRVGWFKLSNGSKAFMASLGDRVVALRKRDGTYLLLAPRDFDSFVEALARHGWLGSGG
ncbi:MAG: hypothetical protein DRJ96_04685 [Thermoprotei archaeon]|nr:MAG: hypothetical protein DRJ67_02905 [Thermoprotei archaeon]RLE97136.1 MAG: hypothetical protein DRJ96_04685 [Thermoprotei archaeon]